MRKLVFLLIIFVAIGVEAKSQNTVNVQKYITSECFEGIDSVFISISPKELRRKNLEEIVILKTVDSLKVLTLKKIDLEELGESKKLIWAMRCLVKEGEKSLNSKKMRKKFFDHYLETRFYYTKYVLGERSNQKHEYIFLFDLQMLDVPEVENLVLAREIVSQYVYLYEKSRKTNWKFGVSAEEDQKRQDLEKGMEMLITVYEKGLDKRFAVNDLQKIMETMASYVPPNMRSSYKRNWKMKISRKTGVYLQ